MKQTPRFGMSEGEDAAKEVRRHAEKLRCQGSGGVCLMQKEATLTDSGYAILEWFPDPMRFPKKSLAKLGFLRTTRRCRYER